MNKTLLLLLALISSISLGFSQSERTYMARVTGLSESNSESLDLFLRQQTGISTTRADHNSESVLVMFDLDQLSESQLVALIESQNLHVTCSLLTESPIGIRQKFQSKCYKTGSGVLNENEER